LARRLVPRSRAQMPRKGRNIVAVGTSAGGLEALDELIGQLSKDIPASIFVVQHLAPEGSGNPLLERLSRHKAFRCKLATHGERFERGRIYIAPPDHHLLVKKTEILVTKGARENRHRPGIDPLFRSAAVNHGRHVVGVVLTGMLDDGTAGLIAIRKCGGVTVVQDPQEATYPGMAESALANLPVDHCVRIAEMGPLLDKLTREAAGPGRPIPEDVKTEAIIAERVLSDVSAVNSLGDLVPYNCPNCRGGAVEHEGFRNQEIPLPHRALVHRRGAACEPDGEDRRDAVDRSPHVRGTP
jgi:two-component system, chemotaxis family, protein-glutamate methylesterase/glutaminase